MDQYEVGWKGLDWIDLPLDREMWQAVVNKVMNLRVPQNACKFLTLAGIACQGLYST